MIATLKQQQPPPSGSGLQRRQQYLYLNTRGRGLDYRLFPALAARFDPVGAMDMLRRVLVTGPGGGHTFAEDLRGHVVWLYNALPAPGDGRSDVTTQLQMPPEECHRLRLSMCEAIAHIEDWAERHGIDACGKQIENVAACCGWPLASGEGWMPPWHLLCVEKPTYWGAVANA